MGCKGGRDKAWKVTEAWWRVHGGRRTDEGDRVAVLPDVWFTTTAFPLAKARLHRSTTGRVVSSSSSGRVEVVYRALDDATQPKTRVVASPAVAGEGVVVHLRQKPPASAPPPPPGVAKQLLAGTV